MGKQTPLESIATLLTKKKLSHILIKAVVKSLWFVSPNETQLYKSSTDCLLSCVVKCQIVKLTTRPTNKKYQPSEAQLHNHPLTSHLQLINIPDLSALQSLFMVMSNFPVSIIQSSPFPFWSSEVTLQVHLALGKWHVTERGTPLQCLTSLPLSWPGVKFFLISKTWYKRKDLTLFKRNRGVGI